MYATIKELINVKKVIMISFVTNDDQRQKSNNDFICHK